MSKAKASKIVGLLEELGIQEYVLLHNSICNPNFILKNPKDYYRLVKKLDLKSRRIRFAPTYVDVLSEKLETCDCHGYTLETRVGTYGSSKNIIKKLKKEGLLSKKTIIVE